MTDGFFRSSKLAVVVLVASLPAGVFGFNVMSSKEKQDSSFSSSTSLASDQMANNWISSTTTSQGPDVFSSIWEAFQPSSTTEEQEVKPKDTFWDSIWKNNPAEAETSTKKRQDQVADAFSVLDSMFGFVTEAVQKPMISLVSSETRETTPKQQQQSLSPPRPLAQQGDWTAYLDRENTGLVYYYNVKTGKSQWNPPSPDFPSIDAKAIRSASLLKSSGIWSAYLDEQGFVYYYNRLTRVSTWEKPASFPQINVGPRRLAPRALAKQGHWSAYPSDHYLSHRPVYYFNEVTGVSQWDPPSRNFPSVEAPTPASSSSRHDEEEHHDENSGGSSWLDGVMHALGHVSDSGNEGGTKKKQDDGDSDETMSASMHHQTKEEFSLPSWMGNDSEKSGNEKQAQETVLSKLQPIGSVLHKATMLMVTVGLDVLSDALTPAPDENDGEKASKPAPTTNAAMGQKPRHPVAKTVSQKVDSDKPDTKSSSTFSSQDSAVHSFSELDQNSNEFFDSIQPQEFTEKLQPVGSALQKATMHMVAVGLDTLANALKPSSDEKDGKVTKPAPSTKADKPLPTATKTVAQDVNKKPKPRTKSKSLSRKDTAIHSFSDLEQKSDEFVHSIAESKTNNESPVDFMALARPVGSVIGKMLQKSTTEMVVTGLDVLTNGAARVAEATKPRPSTIADAVREGSSLQVGTEKPTVAGQRSNMKTTPLKVIADGARVASQRARVAGLKMGLDVLTSGAAHVAEVTKPRSSTSAASREGLRQAGHEKHTVAGQGHDIKNRPLKVIASGARVASQRTMDRQAGKSLQKQDLPKATWNSYSPLKQEVEKNRKYATELNAFSQDAAVHSLSGDQRSDYFDVASSVESNAKNKGPIDFFGDYSAGGKPEHDGVTAKSTSSNAEFNVDAVVKSFSQMVKQKTGHFSRSLTKSETKKGEPQVDLVALARPVGSILQKTTILLVLAGLNALSDALDSPHPSTSISSAGTKAVGENQQSPAQRAVARSEAAEIEFRPSFSEAVNTDPLAHVEPDIPHLASWRQNKDGTVTGIVRHMGKELFPLHSTLTTSPVGAGAGKHTVVETEFGGRYLLL